MIGGYVQDVCRSILRFVKLEGGGHLFLDLFSEPFPALPILSVDGVGRVADDGICCLFIARWVMGNGFVCAKEGLCCALFLHCCGRLGGILGVLLAFSSFTSSSSSTSFASSTGSTSFTSSTGSASSTSSAGFFALLALLLCWVCWFVGSALWKPLEIFF